MLKRINRLARKYLNTKCGSIVFYPYEKELFKKIMKIYEETKPLLYFNEMMLLYKFVEGTNNLDGDIAEVGCYTGGSTKVICEAKGNKPLWVFDTFEGLVDTQEIDKKVFQDGYYKADFDSVSKLLKPYDAVYLNKGYFPTQIPYMLNYRRFCFVNLDVDTYKSTKECLSFFYPKMVKGGIIFIHDYLVSEGVRKAVEEVKLNPITLIGGSYAMVIKQ